jgi:hypothetical protein
MKMTRVAAAVVVWMAVAPVAWGIGQATAPGEGHGEAYGAAPAKVEAAEAAVRVPVRAVTLFSSGVGYFEHFGSVTGNGSTELRFKTGQINDILKSLVLQDLDGGRVATVNYASQEPLERKLRSFQVDVSGNPTLGSLLGQLRGAKVTLRVSGREVSGTILGVEKKQVGQGQSVVERNVISVISGGVIRSEVVEDLIEIRLDDPALQVELGRALEALAGARDQEKKSVELRFVGDGERRVRVGYVVETPVWKTSYRLLIGKADAPSSVQGWAIVENQTDEDWKDVQLSLVSGRPISFMQDLYTPLFVTRPVVVPELFASLRPQQYEGGGRLADREKAAEFGRDEERKQLGRAGLAMRAPAAAAMPAPSEAATGMPGLGQMDAAASVQSIASAASVGELFQYTVGSVSLPRQTSAMIPIVTDPIEVEKVSIYNASVMPRNPLNGARVKNTTGKHLLAGPVTVIEAGTYAGDARIDNLPPGQERLVSYGVDLQMLVDATKNSTSNVVQTARISGGVMEVVRKVVQTQEYGIENKSEAVKTVIIEHPRRGGEWKLVDTAKPIESTDSVHRFKDSVEPGKSSRLVVKEELTLSEGIAIANFSADQFLAYAATGGVPEPVRKALTRAAELKRELNQTEQAIALRTSRISEMTQEQNRIRENLRTVQQNSEYGGRLLKKLDEQETAIEGLQREITALRTTLEQRSKALSDYLQSLEIK